MTGLAPEIPEDLYMLIKKVISIPFPLAGKQVTDKTIRPSLSASISSGIAKTKTPNSVSFLSNPASTVCRATTSLSASYHLHGDTRVLLRAHWWHRLDMKHEGRIR